MQLKLNRHDNTQGAIVTIGAAELFFSYAACIAVRGTDENGNWRTLANPRYRGYSVTTSKHFSQLGCKGFDDAESEEAFCAVVSSILKGAL